jgi:type I restriction enzyme R subunit
LEKLDQAGFGKDELSSLQKLIDAEKSDLFDVLEYVFNSEIKPITRHSSCSSGYNLRLVERQTKEFIEFVLKYIETGVEELDQE